MMDISQNTESKKGFKNFLKNPFDTFFHFLSRFKYFVLLFWVLALIVSFYFGIKFMSNTKLDFEAPKGTKADKANELFKEVFAGSSAMGSKKSMVILLKTKDRSNVLCNATKALSENIASWLKNKYSDVEGVTGYYQTINTLPKLSGLYVSPDKSATMMSASYKEDAQDKAVDIRKYMDDYDNGNLELHLISEGAILDDVLETSTADAERMDYTSLPLAIAILAWVLKSVSLVIYPLICFGFTLFISFAIMYPISCAISVASFCPSMIMSISIAMSIDYGLFLLSRYKEEVESGKPNEECVKETLKNAGRTVLSSGGMLLLCFICIIFFPISIIKTFGISLTISLTVCLSTSLTLTPVLLLIFPKFSRSPFPCLKKYRKDPEVKTQKEKDSQEKSSIFFKASTLMTKNKIAIAVVVGVLCFIIPFAVFMKDFKISMDSSLNMIKGSDSLEAVDSLSNTFAAGMMNPYFIMMVPKSGTNASAFSEEGFQVMEGVISVLSGNVEGISRSEITALSNLAGLGKFNFSQAENFINYNITQLGFNEDAVIYKSYASSLTSVDKRSAMIMLTTSYDPSTRIPYVVDAVRGHLGNIKDQSRFEFFMKSSLVDQRDAVSEVSFYFPIIIVIMAVVVLLVLFFIFRYAILPLRTLITISMSILWLFGLMSIIFILAGDGIYWFVPIATFPIVVGLALDYDVFLFSRIAEMKRKKHTSRAAIVRGYTKSIKIVLWACAIMAIAFAGLIISSVSSLRQMGAYLSLGVLVDGFVMCLFFVPSSTWILKKWAWWPRNDSSDCIFDADVDSEVSISLEDITRVKVESSGN